MQSPRKTMVRTHLPPPPTPVGRVASPFARFIRLESAGGLALLAFPDGDLADVARIGILVASLCAGAAGSLLVRRATGGPRARAEGGMPGIGSSVP